MRISKNSLLLPIWIIVLLIVGCSDSVGPATTAPMASDPPTVNEDSNVSATMASESTKLVSSTLESPPNKLEEKSTDPEPEPEDSKQFDLDQEFLVASKLLIEIESRRVALIDRAKFAQVGEMDYSVWGARFAGVADKKLAFTDGLGKDNLSSLLFEIAAINVPENLKSLKAELLEIYRLEIMATYLSGDCLSGCGDSGYGLVKRHSSRLEVDELNVISKIQESNKQTSPAVRIDSPWVTAQLHRYWVYEGWINLLDGMGVDLSESPWSSISLSENCRNGEKQFC
jgi:hypothetical protein